MRLISSFVVGVVALTLPFMVLMHAVRIFELFSDGLSTGLEIVWLILGGVMFGMARQENKYMALGFLLGGILPLVTAFIINNGILILNS